MRLKSPSQNGHYRFGEDEGAVQCPDSNTEFHQLEPPGYRAMNTLAREADLTAEAVMRIYPLAWFYEGQQP